MSAGGSPAAGAGVVEGVVASPGGVEEAVMAAAGDGPVLEADVPDGAELVCWDLPARFALRGVPPGMRMRFWPGGVVDSSALSGGSLVAVVVASAHRVSMGAA